MRELTNKKLLTARSCSQTQILHNFIKIFNRYYKNFSIDKVSYINYNIDKPKDTSAKAQRGGKMLYLIEWGEESNAIIALEQVKER